MHDHNALLLGNSLNQVSMESALAQLVAQVEDRSRQQASGSAGGSTSSGQRKAAGAKRGQAAEGDAGGSAGGDRPAKRPRGEAAAAPEVSPRDVDRCFSSDNRCCPPGTLHRISALRNPRSGRVIGLTYRVGRHLPGVAGPLADVLADLAGRGRAWARAGAEAGRGTPLSKTARHLSGSLLLLGRPGSGKTTLRRDIAAHLSDGLGLGVVVVDTSNEIAGGDALPHACIGSARRLMVGHRSRLAEAMIEAVQNHGPQVIVVDEIANAAEVAAARTIAARGVMLVATAHGTGLHSLMANNQLNSLTGGLQALARPSAVPVPTPVRPWPVQPSVGVVTSQSLSLARALGGAVSQPQPPPSPAEAAAALAAYTAGLARGVEVARNAVVPDTASRQDAAGRDLAAWLARLPLGRTLLHCTPDDLVAYMESYWLPTRRVENPSLNTVSTHLGLFSGLFARLGRGLSWDETAGTGNPCYGAVLRAYRARLSPPCL